MITWASIEDAIHAWIVASSGFTVDQVIHEKGQVPRPTPPYIGIRLAIEKRGQDWINVVNNPLVLANDVVDNVDGANDELDLAAHVYETGDGPIRLITSSAALPSGLEHDTDYWIIKINAGSIQLASSFVNAMTVPAVPVAFGGGAGTYTIIGTATTTRAGQEITHTVRGPRRLTVSLQCYGAEASGAVRPSAVLNDVLTKALLPSVAGPLDTAGIALAIFSEVQEFDVKIGPNTDIRGLLTVLAHLAEEISEGGTFIETAEVTQVLPSGDLPITLGHFADLGLPVPTMVLRFNETGDITDSVGDVVFALNNPPGVLGGSDFGSGVVIASEQEYESADTGLIDPSNGSWLIFMLGRKDTIGGVNSPREFVYKGVFPDARIELSHNRATHDMRFSIVDDLGASNSLTVLDFEDDNGPLWAICFGANYTDGFVMFDAGGSASRIVSLTIDQDGIAEPLRFGGALANNHVDFDPLYYACGWQGSTAEEMTAGEIVAILKTHLGL